MGTARRQFTDEFKREAVGLLTSSGRPLSQIAQELGIAAFDGFCVLQSFDDLLCIVLIVSLTLRFCTSSRTKLTIFVNSFCRLRRLKLFGSDWICSLIPINSRSSFGHMTRN